MASFGETKRRGPQGGKDTTVDVGSDKGSAAGESGDGSSDWKQFLLFNLSGAIGTLLFYFFYEGMFYLYPSATVCWTVSYAVSIAWQHSLHRFLVFGSDDGVPYLTSLMKTYVVYSASMVLSSLGTYVMVDMLAMNHRVAWVAALAATGAINYFASTMWAFSKDD